MTLTVTELFNGSTNIAALVFLFLHWRHDRRIVRLETHNFGPEGMKE